MDVSATYDCLRRVEALDALARRSGATTVLGVGLVPGLTNLLAKHRADVLGEEPRGVDVPVLLCLGETHGKEGIRLVVENLDNRSGAPGAPGLVASLEDPSPALFPGGFGRRTCYRFDLADQHFLARTLGAGRGAGRAATRLCFDSAGATRLLVAFLSRLHFGADGFAVVAETEGKGGAIPVPRGAAERDARRVC